MESFKKYKFKLVNGEVQPFDQYPEARLNSDGVPVHYDDYGMGAVEWLLMEKPEDAETVIKTQNINWAKRRLPWAVENNPKEVKYLQAVLDGKKQHFKLVK